MLRSTVLLRCHGRHDGSHEAAWVSRFRTHARRAACRRQFAAGSAQEALPFFESAVPDDGRPRAAIKAAFLFADGSTRTNLQRRAATDAHRAAAEAGHEVSRLAAGSAGDAAAAAYLHPLAKATQVGHILRATARAAEAAELEAGDQPETATAVLERARLRATPVLLDVLHRYPPAVSGRSRTAQLMKALDTALRALSATSRSTTPPPDPAPARAERCAPSCSPPSASPPTLPASR